MSDEDNTQPQSELPVGQVLKKRRQSMKLSLAEVELATKIRGKYLIALETGNYDGLPNDIYSRGFVQHYADYLGLSGTELASRYVAERGGLEKAPTKRPQLAPPKKLVVTGRVAAVLGIALALIGVILYLVWQFSALAAPPQLVLTSPAASQIVTGGVVDVVGHVSAGADVLINNSPVLTDSNGSFSERVALQDGLNTLRIVARTKLGKATTVARNVLAHVPKLDAMTATVPPKPFDGVALAVMVKDKATAVVVTVDGKVAWRGTVLPGWSQLFTGTSEIDLTTGNAGVTSVTVTNQTVANKLLGVLGHDGEIRTNQVFTKTTVFP